MTASRIARVVRNLSFVMLCSCFILLAGERSAGACGMELDFHGDNTNSIEAAAGSCNNFGDNGGCATQCSDCGGTDGFSGCSLGGCTWLEADQYSPARYRCFGTCSCKGAEEM